MEHYLPPGAPAEWNPDEYCCDFCPNPECRRENKFHWNVEKEVGRCFVCGFWINNWDSFKYHFRNANFENIDFGERKPIVHTTRTSNLLINAWDHEKSQEFLRTRRVNELKSREYEFLYNPEENSLYVNINPLSPDLPQIFLSRSLRAGSKWYVKKATQGIYYGWGWEKFTKSKQNVLICEGIFDLVSTGLDHRGIALLGSKPNDIWYSWLRKNVNKVTLWFDNDLAGHKALVEISEKCLFHGIPYDTIRTKSHPKEYDRSIPSDLKLLKKVEELIDHTPMANTRRYLNR